MYRSDAYVPPPDQDEVRIAILRLWYNKAPVADGIPAELFKAGGVELVRRMYQLLRRIWSVEYAPEDWKLRALCPMRKK